MAGVFVYVRKGVVRAQTDGPHRQYPRPIGAAPGLRHSSATVRKTRIPEERR
jgi:hypothetical protein